MNKIESTSYLRRGRTVQLNIHKLECTKNKDYAGVLFFGDLHLGYPTFLLHKATEMLDYALENHVYVIGMGDLLECGTTRAPGDSVYRQKLNPQEQIDDCIKLLSPLAEAGLLLGIHNGNHEARVSNLAGVHVCRIMAGVLDVPYLGGAVWHHLKVGKNTYRVYTTHGKSSARFPHTKLKAAIDVAHTVPSADVVAHAHVHEIASHILERMSTDTRNKQVVFPKTYVLLTGHYLGFLDSYAQEAGYYPGRIGSPKVKLYRDVRDVHSRT